MFNRIICQSETIRLNYEQVQPSCSWQPTSQMIEPHELQVQVDPSAKLRDSLTYNQYGAQMNCIRVGDATSNQPLFSRPLAATLPTIGYAMNSPYKTDTTNMPNPSQQVGIDNSGAGVPLVTSRPLNTPIPYGELVGGVNASSAARFAASNPLLPAPYGGLAGPGAWEESTWNCAELYRKICLLFWVAMLVAVVIFLIVFALHGMEIL